LLNPVYFWKANVALNLAQQANNKANDVLISSIRFCLKELTGA
jgi:hypothetical protein